MTTTSLYWQPSLPQHAIVRYEDAYYLVPLIAGGWQRRTPYRGHLTGLQPMEPRASWPVLGATLGIPGMGASSESKTYTIEAAAAELGLSYDRTRRLAIARGLGRKHSDVWMLTDAEIDLMRERKPGRPPKAAE